MTTKRNINMSLETSAISHQPQMSASCQIWDIIIWTLHMTLKQGSNQIETQLNTVI